MGFCFHELSGDLSCFRVVASICRSATYTGVRKRVFVRIVRRLIVDYVHRLLGLAGWRVWLPGLAAGLGLIGCGQNASRVSGPSCCARPTLPVGRVVGTQNHELGSPPTPGGSIPVLPPVWRRLPGSTVGLPALVASSGCRQNAPWRLRPLHARTGSTARRRTPGHKHPGVATGLVTGIELWSHRKPGFFYTLMKESGDLLTLRGFTLRVKESLRGAGRHGSASLAPCRFSPRLSPRSLHK